MSTTDEHPVLPELKPRRTEEKSVRRLQLIEATIDCIAKYGLSGATLARVTERAGLSMGLVNFHFDNKDRLFEETLRHVASEHRDQWQKSVRAKGLTDSDRLVAIMDSFFHPRICSRKKLAVWFAFFGEAANRNTYRSIVADIDEERHQVSMRLIRSMVAARPLNNLDPVFVSLTLEALMDGLWLNLLLYPEDFSVEKSRAQVRAVLGLFFPDDYAACATQSDGPV
jgi:TetR/AcrR family transcriptional repressor of bet genes